MRMDQHIKQLIEKYTFEAARLSHYEALERYNMAYAQAKELGNAFTIRACAANLGAMYVSLGKKAEAEKGLKYLKEATPPEGTADCVSKGDLFFNFGLAYKVLGRFREAGSSFKQALEEYEEERDNLNMKIETLKQLIQVILTIVTTILLFVCIYFISYSVYLFILLLCKTFSVGTSLFARTVTWIRV